MNARFHNAESLRAQLAKVSMPTLDMPAPVVVEPTVRFHTPEAARADLSRQGIAVTHWARHHGFKVSLVYAVLEGRAKGSCGKSHNIAVLRGLKAGVVTKQVPA